MAEKMEQDLMYQKILWMKEDIKQATKAKQDELKQLREARRVREVFRFFFQNIFSLISFLLKQTKINVWDIVRRIFFDNFSINS